MARPAGRLAHRLSHKIGQVWSPRPPTSTRPFAAPAAAQPPWTCAAGQAAPRCCAPWAMPWRPTRPPDRASARARRGKTLADGIAEVREAADFCRYYAQLAERSSPAPRRCTGPVGETNQPRACTAAASSSASARGTSRWPIFTGQIAAALAAGNAVVAKPAEQTPLIAAEAVKLFHDAGVAAELLHLLPGDGATVGAALTAHPGCDGVAFTGGTDTALRRSTGRWRRAEARSCRSSPRPAASTRMFVDTTALREQVRRRRADLGLRLGRPALLGAAPRCSCRTTPPTC